MATDKILIGLFGTVITFAIIIIALSLITGVVDDVKVDSLEGDNVVSVVNETVIWTNETFVALANIGKVSLSCSTVYNNATGSTWDGTDTSGDANISINSGNWTCTNSGINITDLTTPSNEINITTTVFVNYNYQLRDAEYNISQEGITGLLNTSDQFGNIGTIIAIMIIIGVLVGAFAVFIRKS